MGITRGGFIKLAAATIAGASGLGRGAAGVAADSAATAAAGDRAESAATGAGRNGAGAADGPRAAGVAATPGPAAGALDSQRFRAAVAAGDAARVAAYLERDPALAGSRDERGRSVLAIACLDGRQEVAALRRRRLPALDLVEAALLGDAARVQWWLGKAPGLLNEPDATGSTRSMRRSSPASRR
jgi:hypothetical protein